MITIFLGRELCQIFGELVLPGDYISLGMLVFTVNIVPVCSSSRCTNQRKGEGRRPPRSYENF